MRGISRFKITFESLFQHLHPTASISHYNPQSFIFLPFFSIVFLRWHHLFLPLSFCHPPLFLAPLTSTTWPRSTFSSSSSIATVFHLQLARYRICYVPSLIQTSTFVFLLHSSHMFSVSTCKEQVVSAAMENFSPIILLKGNLLPYLYRYLTIV